MGGKNRAMPRNAIDDVKYVLSEVHIKKLKATYT